MRGSVLGAERKEAMLRAAMAAVPGLLIQTFKNTFISFSAYLLRYPFRTRKSKN